MEQQPELESKMSHKELIQYLTENRELSLSNTTELVNRGVSLFEVRAALDEIER